MDKAYILSEIKRTAEANGGPPLGSARFSTETGIKKSDWHGVFWARWGDALREAGFPPNEFNAAWPTMDLLGKFAQLAIELGRLPTKGEVKLRKRVEKEFPSPSAFSRLGTKSELVGQLAEFCRARVGYESVLCMCEEYVTRSRPTPEPSLPEEVEIGFVYLMQSGRFFKIGRTNAAGRREYELGIQLPERPNTIHVIRTDDPAGIEAYWHRRFEAKRKNGEWFELDKSDIAAFKRRKFM